jgi:hypothetical protein
MAQFKLADRHVACLAQVVMSSGVISWWMILCAVGALNVAAWAFSVVRLRRRQAQLSSECYIARRRQLVLSAVYVFGCAFRSVLPVYDVPRLALFDTWLSSVVVGRTVATIAELCFVAQWALMLRESARVSGSVVASRVSMAVVPMIVVAELCSWYSVLTTSNIGHVFEETLWGVSAALVVGSMMVVRPHCASIPRSVFFIWCGAGVAYVAYMFLVDVPMYWSRWVADEAIGRQYLSLAQGFLDVSERRVVSHSWNDWKSEIAWMTLYFSVAVWMSISFIHAPEQRRHRTVTSAP